MCVACCSLGAGCCGVYVVAVVCLLLFVVVACCRCLLTVVCLQLFVIGFGLLLCVASRRCLLVS